MKFNLLIQQDSNVSFHPNSNKVICSITNVIIVLIPIMISNQQNFRNFSDTLSSHISYKNIIQENIIFYFWIYSSVNTKRIQYKYGTNIFIQKNLILEFFILITQTVMFLYEIMTCLDHYSLYKMHTFLALSVPLCIFKNIIFTQKKKSTTQSLYKLAL